MFIYIYVSIYEYPLSMFIYIYVSVYLYIV